MKLKKPYTFYILITLNCILKQNVSLKNPIAKVNKDIFVCIHPVI